MEQRILIHAPAGKDAQLAARVLQGAGMDCFVCAGSADAVRELGAGAGALLIAEEALDPETLAALGRFVAEQAAWSDMPVLVLTKYGPDQDVLEAMARTLGNVTFLERPVRTSGLTSAVRSALRARNRQYQVRELDRRKDEFLASLSHELRNPLAPIRTSMAVLRGVENIDGDVRRVCEVVERQVTYLSRLVDDLLDVARITSGKTELRRQPVPLASVVAHAAEICAPLLAAVGHRLAVTQPDGDVMLDADQTRLVQSLSNILANACKFTKEPSTIEFDVAVDGEEVRFCIRDPGRGIEASSLSRIFDMFVQSDSVQDPTLGGLGIGLSLAKRFTEMHGGTIHAVSDGIGRGSEFVLTLPVVVAVAGTALADAAEPDATPGSGLRILVVDDNRDGADMLQMVLEAQGFTVTAAYTGSQAVETAQAWQPDVVVIDIGLPDIDGYEAARRIRRQPSAAATRIIALTGWGDQDARRLGVEAGIDHHLVKPVDLDLLRAHLDDVAQRGARARCA